MRGRTPKPPGLRKGHRRRSSTAAVLPTEAKAAEQEVPPLPPRRGKWHERVVEWWVAIWQSPMATQYIAADKPGLDMLAVMQQAFWTARVAKDRVRFAAEIRRREEKYGLDPISRRRLEWEIGRGEEAAAKTKARRQRKQGKKDPRDVLKLEK